MVFPANASTAVVTLTAIQDIPLDNGETAILTVAAGPASGAGAYAIGTPSTATVTIADNGPPVITLVATDATATEGPADTGAFTFTRAGGNLAAALTVNFTCRDGGHQH